MKEQVLQAMCEAGKPVSAAIGFVLTMVLDVVLG